MITSALSHQISTVDTILIGENHGVVENVSFVKDFVDELINTHKIKFVGFEYPIFVLDEFKSAVATKNFDEIRNNEVAQMLTKDGRFSKFHFELLVHLQEIGTPFIFFDSGRGTWDDRDSEMYENITKEAEKYREGGIKVIVAGNIHTTLELLNLDNKSYKPLGTYFDPRRTLLIKLEYHDGDFFNFSRKPFTKNKSSNRDFEKTKENEYLYHIPLATPTAL